MVGTICSYPWECETALAVVWCESRYDPAAIGAGSYGLWQLNSIHAYRWPSFWENWSDPEMNTAWAFELWQEQGFSPWSCW